VLTKDIQSLNIFKCNLTFSCLGKSQEEVIFVYNFLCLHVVAVYQVRVILLVVKREVVA